MDIQNFSKRLREIRNRKNIKQNILAEGAGITGTYLSLMLSGQRTLTTDIVKKCILYLVQEGAILEQEEVRELLQLAACEDFSEGAWRAYPLNELSISDTPSSSSPTSSDEKAETEQKSLSLFDAETARAEYLEGVISWYGFLTLPVRSQKRFPLQDVFQPVALKHPISLIEELTYKNRRKFLDETSEKEDHLQQEIIVQSALFDERNTHTTETIAIDGFDALNKSTHQRLVILGSPGIGKTTLLKHFTIETAKKALANRDTMLPIFATLPEWVDSHQSFSDFLSTTVGKLGVDTRYANELRNAIEQGKAFICLDLLEQVSPKKRQDIVLWLNAQATKPGNVWIIASRFNEYDGGQFSQEFTEWELYALSDASREDLTTKLIQIFSRQKNSELTQHNSLDSAQFLSALSSHTYTVNWGRNPLLLSLAVNSFVRTGTFPSSRTALYKETIATMIAIRQEDRNKQIVIRMIVAALALQLYEDHQRLLTREDLLMRLGKIHIPHYEGDNIEELVQSILDTGILEIAARDTYGFPHQTFQEYFAAVALAQRLLDRETRSITWDRAWQKRIYSRWTEALHLMVGILVQEYAELGGLKVALSWLQALLHQNVREQKDVADLGLTLVIRSMNEVGESVTIQENSEWIRFSEEIIDAWMHAWIDAVKHDLKIRQQKLLLLINDIRIWNKELINLLVKLLEKEFIEGDWKIRVGIMHALGQCRSDVPLDHLVHTLSDPHKQVRTAAVYTMIGLRDFVPTKAVLKVLESENERSREAAIQVLGGLKRADTINDLLISTSDPSWFVRAASIEALGNLEDAFSLETLLDLLNDNDSFIRYEAIIALGKRSNDVSSDQLIAMLDDPDDLVCCAAIEILGIRAPVEKLIKIITSPPTGWPIPTKHAYSAACELLAPLGEQKLVEHMLLMNQSDNEQVQEIAKSIVESQQPSSQEKILQALRSNHQTDRIQAIKILCNKHDWDYLDQFVASQESFQEIVLATTLRLAGKLNDQTLTKHMITNLQHTNPQVRLAALQALKDLGTHIPKDAIIAQMLFDDEDYFIRTTALNVFKLVSQHAPLTLPLIETLLSIASQDEYKPARNAAKQCLEKLGGKIAHEDLMPSLVFHEQSEVRYTTLSILWQYIPLKMLRSLTVDEDQEICDIAKSALEKRKRNHPILGIFYKKKRSSPLVSIQINIKSYPEVQLLKEFCGDIAVDQLPSSITIPMDDVDEWDLPLKSGRKPGEMSLWVDETDDAKDSYTKAVNELNKAVYDQTIHLLRESADVDQLMARLNHEIDDVRLVALQTLGERTPMRQLLEVLDDDSIIVRQQALKILDIRTPMKHVVNALDDKDEEVRQIALTILTKLVATLPEAQLIEAMESKSAKMRISAIKALERRISPEKLLAACSDSEEEVRPIALETLKKVYPEMLAVIRAEATAIIVHGKSSTLLDSVAQCFMLDVISHMDYVSPFLRRKLTDLLTWPHWEVQAKAAQIVGTLQQNIPQEAIASLLELRNTSSSQAVREATDEALAELLSLEVGLEDSQQA